MKTQTIKPQVARSLTATLAIAFLALSVVVLLISGGLQVFSNFQTQQATLASQQQLIAHEASRTVSGFIQEKFSVLETSVRLAGPATLSQEAQKQILESLLGPQPAFRQLVLLNAEDRELVKTSRISRAASGQLADHLKGDVLTQIRQGKRYVSPVYIDPVTSEPLVIMAVPATNVFGDYQGTLVTEINLKFMWDLVDQLKVGETGYAYVVDRQGNLIAFGDTARVLQGENVRNLVEVDEFIESTTSFDAEPVRLATGIRGTTVVGTHVPLGTPDWAVVTELPWQEAYQPVIRNVAVSVGITVVMAVLAGLMGAFLARRLAVPLVNLTGTATRIASGETELQAEVGGSAEVARLATAFNSMTQQLRSLISSLEQRVEERTAALELRSRHLQASSEIGRAASSILETEQLIRQVVELIHERFGLYYVGLFLADAAGEWAVLRAGTGEAGQKMLARGHKLQIGGGSMIGWSIANAQPRIAQVAAEDSVRLATAELPNTRSEAALPLRARGKVLGALTVQSDRPGAFDEAALAVLQIMADQVAIALENARLFAESQAALETTRRAYGELSRQGWMELLRTRQELGYRYAQASTAPTEGEWQPEMIQAVASGQSVVVNPVGVNSPKGLNSGAGNSTLAVPLKVRDQIIGVLDLRRDTPGRPWTDEEKALAETLTEQLGTTLESARHYQDAQRRAAQERLVGQVTARMSETLDMETVLRTAIREMGEALGMAEVEVRMGTPTDGNGYSKSN